MKRQVNNSDLWKGVIKYSCHCGDHPLMWLVSQALVCFKGWLLWRKLINEFSSPLFFFFLKKKQSANSLLSYLLPGRGRGGKQLAWSLQPYPDKRDVALLMYNSCRLLNCLHLPNVEFVTCPRRALLALLTWPDLEALGTQPHPPTSHRPRLSLAEGWLKGPLPSSLLLAPLSL